MQLVIVLLNKLFQLFLCLFVWIKNFMLPFYWWHSMKQKTIMYGSGGAFTDLKAEANFSNGFSKIPMHIAFIFPDEDLINLDVMTCLLIWSCLCGIPNISLYDIHGRIKWFYKELTLSPFLKQYPLQFVDFSAKSALSNGVADNVKVHLLDSRSGRPEFADMIRQCAMIKQNFSPADVDSYFKSAYHFSGPDLAVVVGDAPISSYGYPPWALRLTEFYSLPKLSAGAFSQLLYRFSKTEQRYGR